MISIFGLWRSTRETGSFQLAFSRYRSESMIILQVISNIKYIEAKRSFESLVTERKHSIKSKPKKTETRDKIILKFRTFVSSETQYHENHLNNTITKETNFIEKKFCRKKFRYMRTEPGNQSLQISSYNDSKNPNFMFLPKYQNA